MTHIYVVTATDLRFESIEILRAFTKIEDAKTFISKCEWETISNNYRYEFERVELNGDPEEGY